VSDKQLVLNVVSTLPEHATLGEINAAIAREAAANSSRAAATPRVLGLHPGSIWTSDDFNAPLPDEFWLGAQ